MLLCYLKFICLVDLILIHYVLWQITKDSLSLKQITAPKSLATYGQRHNPSLLQHIQRLQRVSAEAPKCHTLVHLCNICIHQTSKARNVQPSGAEKLYYCYCFVQLPWQKLSTVWGRRVVASIPASRAFKADTVGETQHISCKTVVLTRRHHCFMISLTESELHTPSLCLATGSHFVPLLQSHGKQSHLV